MNSAISSAGVEPTLKHFDDLPSSAHVDANVAAAIFGISISTLRRRVKDGRLPAPHGVCGHMRFRVGELRAIEDRPFKERPFAFDMPSAGLDAGAFAAAAEFSAIVGARA